MRETNHFLKRSASAAAIVIISAVQTALPVLAVPAESVSVQPQSLLNRASQIVTGEFPIAKPIAYPDERARLLDYVYLGKFAEISQLCDIKIEAGTAKAFHYQASSLGWLYPSHALTAKAVRTCEEGLQRYPDDLALLWTSAVCYARNLQWSTALRRANQVLTIDPKNVQAIAVKAICLHRAGREDQGLLLLRNGLAIDPGNQELNMLIAFYARMRNRVDDAYIAFDRWNKLNPRSAVGFSWRGEYEMDTGRPDEALKSFQKAVSLNSNYVAALYKIGKLSYNKQNWEIACQALMRTEALGGHHETGITKLCDCLLRTKRYKEAIGACNTAMERLKDGNVRKPEDLGVPGFTVMHESTTLVEIQVKRAIAFYYLGDMKSALADVASVLKEHPENVPALDLKQKIGFKTGDYVMAAECLSKLIDIDHDVQMWYENRANAYRHLGKLDAAKKDLMIVDVLNKTGKLPDS